MDMYISTMKIDLICSQDSVEVVPSVADDKVTEEDSDEEVARGVPPRHLLRKRRLVDSSDKELNAYANAVNSLKQSNQEHNCHNKQTAEADKLVRGNASGKRRRPCRS
eukprot:262217-Pleurochrysis_carterae.AAC.1